MKQAKDVNNKCTYLLYVYMVVLPPPDLLNGLTGSFLPVSYLVRIEQSSILNLVSHKLVTLKVP